MASSFRREPIQCFDEQLKEARDAFWLEPSKLCVAEPAAAKAVLANPDGLFEEHSDFFHTSRGPFGPRELQSALGRSARRLLTGHVAARDAALDDSIDELLGRRVSGTSEWPDAGNYLVYRHLRDALVTPEHFERIGPLLEEIIERSVLAGARESRSFFSRLLFRRRAYVALTREIEHRRGEIDRSALTEPRDLFDVLALCARTYEEAREREQESKADRLLDSDLGELYLPFYFAVVSSVGFTLAWALYLLGTNPDVAESDAAPGDVVREALRLWPIAWQTGRKPAKPHEIAGIKVTPKTEIVVSAYVTHRHPKYWDEPNRFLPERWAGRNDHTAYFPFGWGPHTCAAASLSLQLATAMVAGIRRRFRLSVRPRSVGSQPDRPFLGPSLAPPRFRLDLAPLNPQTPSQGGDLHGEEVQAGGEDRAGHPLQRLRSLLVPV